MANHHKISLLELIEILTEYRKNIIINIKHLQANYQRTGIKRVHGIRDENGELKRPWLQTEYIDNAEYVSIDKFAFNRNTATVNMLVKRQVKLVKSEDKTPILEVAGLLANDLYLFNNYTIVSNGKLYISFLKIKISSKKAFELLKDVLDRAEFDFHHEYTINLDNLPLVNDNIKYPNIAGLFDELAKIKVILSMITAHLKGESDIFIEPQLDELKNHCLSSNLYINFPTTNEYINRQQALTDGNIDLQRIYKIDIGSKDILNLSKFYSANKFLDKMYRVYDKETGEILTKPNLTMAFHENLAFRHKLLSSRIKITKVDEFMKVIFDDFLGLENYGIVSATLSKIGANSLAQLLQDKFSGYSVSKDVTVAALTDAKTKLEQYANKIYQEKISPLVFYIGATGTLPQEISVPAITAKELARRYPDLQFSKYEQEGDFFVVNDSIISIYAQPTYYSQQVGVSAK
ncbi:hypothetical protein Nos7524_2984 [Nostoc sp. PCC 7524]|uniref:hypothetical protein n=1 Tax=Nostoc sp. (strain ATCC 29411 / PCC 7524) TaxID=28072 RepID=UPI00029EEDED|nr:hypothetical protein [Nostoc sp. PCC 7524]AFY48793.1 hypothetical protein Nos7524_2984 [Nostoc sp. PCC 7524]